MRSQIAEPVARENAIAVVVYDETASGGGLLGMGGPTAEHPLGAFFESNLIEKGFAVKTVDMDKLIPEGFDDWVVLPEEYWEVHADEEGKGEAEIPITDLSFKSYHADAKIRLADLSALVSSIPTSWGIGYLMVVYKMGAYSYVVELVKIAEKKIVFTYMFSGNQKGWEERFSGPPAGAPGRDVSPENKSEWLVWMQLAEQVCSMF
jgi:hypothetical protein